MFPRGAATSEHGDQRFPRRRKSPPNLSFELGIFHSQPVAQTATVSLNMYIVHDRKIPYMFNFEIVMRLWRDNIVSEL